MSIIKFTLPDIGDFDAVDVIEVLVSAGDSINIDDALMTLESDKATMEIPSTVAGKIKTVLVNVGDKVSEGTHVFDIEEQQNNSSGDKQAKQTKAEEAVDNSETQPETQQDKVKSSTVDKSPVSEKEIASSSNPEKPINNQSFGATFHASPAIRFFARKLGVSLENVTGSGHKGRISKADVESHIKSVMQGTDTANSSSGIPPLPQIDFSKFGDTETIELGRIKKLSGKYLHGSWLNSPHVTQFDECDITDMDSFRKAMKPKAEQAGVKLTPLVFIMKAVVESLKQFPNLNSSLSPDVQSIIVKKYYNIGIAIDTPEGLVVPVIRDVNRKSIFELSAELMAVSIRAREGKLTSKDMSGGTFTISSLGGIGGTQFTPIINPPEVAIMGVSKAMMQPVWDGKDFNPRLIMPFSVSYDHRVVDGAEGVRFTSTVGSYLTDLRQLLL